MITFQPHAVIAATRSPAELDVALGHDVEIIFDLCPDLLTLRDVVDKVHSAEKKLFIHLDLAEGIGKDRAGVRYLAQQGVDGIISTKGQIIRYAREMSLLTVQRFFALDSKGMESIEEMLRTSTPHLIEIMPGVIGKAIRRFEHCGIPVIAGGLVETKAEVTEAISCGAAAVSTGKEDLWYL
jgi:glycerol uptake operon antiterminator